MLRLLLYFFLFFSFFVKGQPRENLSAKITFNDSKAYDEIRNKDVKTVNTFFVSDRFGNPNSAAYLHGSPGSYINLGTDKKLKPVKGTISLWVKIEVVIHSGKGYEFNPILITKNGVLNKEGKNDDFYEAYSIAYDFNVRRFSMTCSKSEELQVNIRSLDTLVLYNWHHLAMTFDDDVMCMYLNGKLNASLPKKFSTVYSPLDSVIVGHSANLKNERYFCGMVDDILIYDRVLSPQEIAALFNAPDPHGGKYYWKLLRWALLALFAIGIIVWLILKKYRKDLALQRERNMLIARMNDLETRAIRTQMNPHFMFNALNTLQRFILEEDTANANNYLVKFSNLLRKLLESSMADSISLQEEMEILSTYVDIEKLRFDQYFEFQMSTDVEDPEKVHLPFMLIQPFLENAIWHGLLPKDGTRKLSVTFSKISEKALLCRVEDNGVGRKVSLKKKDPMRKKSMAMEFIKQRLELLEKTTGIKSSLSIIDKENEKGESEGTVIEVIIPIIPEQAPV
jgi:hypothetical protein